VTEGGGMHGVKRHINSAVSPSWALTSDGGSTNCSDFCSHRRLWKSYGEWV